MPSDEHRPSLADRTVLISQSDFMMTEEQIGRRATLDDLDEEFFRRHLRTQGFGLRRVRHSDMVSEYLNFSVIGDREERLAPSPVRHAGVREGTAALPENAAPRGAKHRMQRHRPRVGRTARRSRGHGRLEEQVETEHGVFVIRLLNRGAGTSLRRP